MLFIFRVTFFIILSFYHSSLNKPTDDSLTLRQTHKRIINKLEKLLLQNKSNFESFSKQIDANWSDYLEKTKENNK